MIHIKYRNRVLTSDELRDMGWALIDAATTQDRHAIQLAQSKADPTNEKEREQADRAASAVLRAGRKVIRLIESLTK